MMPKACLLLAAALLLAACGGQPAPTQSPTLAPPTVTLPAPTLALATATDRPAPAATASPAPAATESSLFAPITEADWQTGPQGALVTIVEYSDFQ